MVGDPTGPALTLPVVTTALVRPYGAWSSPPYFFRMSSTLVSEALASSPLASMQRPPVGLGLGLGAGVGRRQPGLDPLGHQLLRLGHQGADHLVLGHDPDDLALDEQVARLAAGGDAEVGLPGLPRSVHDAPHDGHLDGQVAVLQRGLGRTGHGDDVDLGPAAARAGDQVETLALPQAQGLEQLPAGPSLLDRVGGQRVADGVPDPLGQQGGDPGRALESPAGRRPGLGHPEVERMVEGLRAPTGRPRS